MTDFWRRCSLYVSEMWFTYVLSISSGQQTLGAGCVSMFGRSEDFRARTVMEGTAPLPNQINVGG